MPQPRLRTIYDVVGPITELREIRDEVDIRLAENAEERKALEPVRAQCEEALAEGNTT